MKKIPLSKGKEALVSDKDYKKLTAMGKWCFATVGYAVKNLGNKKLGYMHHQVIGKPPNGYVVDHIDMNKLNNQRSNLRFLSHSDSLRNKRRQCRGDQTIPYKGVSRTLNKKRFKAVITVSYRRLKHIGVYDTAIEAARAYDKEVVRLYGNRARRNFYA